MARKKTPPKTQPDAAEQPEPTPAESIMDQGDPVAQEQAAAAEQDDNTPDDPGFAYGLDWVRDMLRGTGTGAAKLECLDNIQPLTNGTAKEGAAAAVAAIIGAGWGEVTIAKAVAACDTLDETLSQR